MNFSPFILIRQLLLRYTNSKVKTQKKKKLLIWVQQSNWVRTTEGKVIEMQSPSRERFSIIIPLLLRERMCLCHAWFIRSYFRNNYRQLLRPDRERGQISAAGILLYFTRHIIQVTLILNRKGNVSSPLKHFIIFQQ